MNINNKLPLQGLKVVEFSHMVMGPSAGLVLADMGADVIKVEPLGGDKTRELRGSGAGYFSMYNRNKRSIRLNLKTPDGLKIAKQLAQDSDILIENFRPGAMARLGLDYPKLESDCPRLIYCSTYGFLSGPYEQRTALDEVAQMMGGLAYMTGPAGRPLRAGASVIDVMGGMFGAIGILAALEQRHVTGAGQLVRSSLYESSVFLVGQHMAQYAVTGEAAAPMPERISAWAVYDVFSTADEQKVFVGIVSDQQWVKFCEFFALDELANDESLRANNARVAARDRLMPVVQELFASMSLDDALEKLETCGLPFAPIKKPQELFDDVHLKESGGLLPLTLSDGKQVELPALPLEMQGKKFGVRKDLPESGEHTSDVLKSLGWDAKQIAELIEQKVVSSGDSE